MFCHVVLHADVIIDRKLIYQLNLWLLKAKQARLNAFSSSATYAAPSNPVLAFKVNGASCRYNSKTCVWPKELFNTTRIPSFNSWRITVCADFRVHNMHFSKIMHKTKNTPSYESLGKTMHEVFYLITYWFPYKQLWTWLQLKITHRTIVWW